MASSSFLRQRKKLPGKAKHEWPVSILRPRNLAIKRAWTKLLLAGPFPLPPPWVLQVPGSPKQGCRVPALVKPLRWLGCCHMAGTTRTQAGLVWRWCRRRFFTPPRHRVTGASEGDEQALLPTPGRHLLPCSSSPHAGVSLGQSREERGCTAG